jgi:hypothetical protein
MNSRQLAELEMHIQRWLDSNCEKDDWPDMITGNRTVEMMANAARSVFDACQESQDYAKREGYVGARS